MARKTVSLSESAYEQLSEANQTDESLSDTVKRLAENQNKSYLTADDIGTIASKCAQEVEERMSH